ncbi:hypothetical protein AB0D30_31000 [Streptomyces sp. NPDC048409]|uniref:hypothetical protein n=1 Tax=Streptomyces sp. NPDC048409 TaxID=3154723 RepID=UPI00341921EC
MTQTRSIVYDPGPTHRCWSVSHESSGASTDPDTSGCAPLDQPERTDTNCQWFPYTGRYGDACPSWRFVTIGWEENKLRKTPGYDARVTGAEGKPLTLQMRNSARKAGDCDLREVAFSYEYTGSSLRRDPADHQPYNFADGRLRVSYDAYLRHSGGFACSEKRAILTTDLIYEAHGKKNVISVVHYDPGHFAGAGKNGVLWSNHCSDGCRVTVAGQRVAPGRTTAVSVDFTALAAKYSAYLGGAVPTSSGIEAVQVVNSTRGADLETRVSHADVTLGAAH